MNPYEVLNVATNASDHEIKAAYRRAVKKYHPDVSYGDDVETIVIINQAYELLSDPQRRNAFDAGLGWIIQEPVEEDPREVYKREYLRRKREEAQNRIARDRKVFRYFYKINVVIAVLAFVFVVDELLPSLVRNEIVIREWILTRRVKGSTYNIRYFQTNNFTFAKPNGIALNYDYDKPEPMRIEVSPIIRIPTKVQIRQGAKELVFEPSRTIYSFAIPFHYVLLLLTGITLLLKKHTPFSFSLAFAPLLVLLMCIWMFGYLS